MKLSELTKNIDGLVDAFGKSILDTDVELLQNNFSNANTGNSSLMIVGQRDDGYSFYIEIAKFNKGETQ